MFRLVMNFTQNQSKNSIRNLELYILISPFLHFGLRNLYDYCKNELSSSKGNLLLMEFVYFTLQKYLEIRYSVILESRFKDNDLKLF